MDFIERRSRVPQVLEDLGEEDQVDAAVLDRQPMGISKKLDRPPRRHVKAHVPEPLAERPPPPPEPMSRNKAPSGSSAMADRTNPGKRSRVVEVRFAIQRKAACARPTSGQISATY